MVKASVWWDINSCPVPDGYDPRLVGPTIDSFLKKKGFLGPLSITAIGDLERTAEDVLRHISSTGIALKHVPFGCFQTPEDLSEWTRHNPSVAGIVLICNLDQLEPLSRTLYDMGRPMANQRYVVSLVYPKGKRNYRKFSWLWKGFLSVAVTQWNWETLLKGSRDSRKQELLQDTCSKSDWFCKRCNSGGQRFENFITHLKSDEHANAMKEPEPLNTPPATTSTVVKRPPQKTWVFWHINSCPLPQGYPPRLVVPRIVSALEKSGYSGPVTIRAIGNLEHMTFIPLKELSSIGIDIEHASSDVETHFSLSWKISHPPPATFMLICGHEHLERLCRTLYNMHNWGYTILLAYPERPPSSDWLWKSFLSVASKEWPWHNLLEVDLVSVDNTRMTGTQVPQENSSETGGLICTVCYFYTTSVENFITHFESEEHEVEPEWDMVTVNTRPPKVTSVLWHINSCPVPDGYIPRLVGPSIVSALEKSGYSDPVTITAVGSLEHTPAELLKELASTGISLKHDLFELESELRAWKRHNPAPATLMLICDHEYLELVSRTIYAMHGLGYKILLAYPQRPQGSDWLWKSFLAVASKDWPWHSLLEVDSGSANDRRMTRSQVLQEKCSSETGECRVCDFACESVENLITHLRSEEHAQEELALLSIYRHSLSSVKDIGQHTHTGIRSRFSSKRERVHDSVLQ